GSRRTPPATPPSRYSRASCRPPPRCGRAAPTAGSIRPWPVSLSKGDSSPNGTNGVNEPASSPELPEVDRPRKPSGRGSVLGDERAPGDQRAAVRRELERRRRPDARSRSAVDRARAGPGVGAQDLDPRIAAHGRPRAVGAELHLRAAVLVLPEEQLQFLPALGVE